MTRSKAEILLAAVIIARSSSYMLMKLGMAEMGAMTLMAVRSFIALVVLAALFYKRLLRIDRKTLLGGALMGALLFVVMGLEMLSLQTTDSSAVSFLSNTAVVFVPLITAIMSRRLPTGAVMVSVLVTIAGVALLTLRGKLYLTAGELMCIFAAALYAVMIIVTDRLSHRDDPLTLGILQTGFCGVFALIAALAFEDFRLPASGAEWGCALALALVCSVFGMAFQPVAQSKSSAEKAGLFCALSPLSAAVMGRVFMAERLGIQGVAGAALIILGIAASYLIKPRAKVEAVSETAETK